MSSGQAIFVLLFLLFAITLYLKRWMLDALIEAINRFGGGGPPTPIHPSPAGDDKFIRRRS